MVNELRSYDAAGNESEYLETWEFTDEAQFEWTLWRKTPEGLKQDFSGVYVRR
jgi:hypothetical protein